MSRRPVLDRIPRFDERSRNFPLREVMSKTKQTARFWTPGPVLDQGQEGACVGFGWTGGLASSPPPRLKVATNDIAKENYKIAQENDEWPGEDYSGSSVLGGAKGMKGKGYIGEYRWCFSIQDVIDAVLTTGPVVIGIDWFEEMYETEPSGIVKTGGDKVGGHCLFVYSYNPKRVVKGVKGSIDSFAWQNSWGHGYGLNGRGIIRTADLEALLKNDGEAVVPTIKENVRFS